MTASMAHTSGGVVENLARVTGNIAEAARRSGRRGEDIRLIAVSKTKPLSVVLEAVHAGHMDFGENRVQEALDKIEQAPTGLRWHLIGHLQSNKARFVPGRFHAVQSVDSAKLARALARAAGNVAGGADCDSAEKSTGAAGPHALNVMLQLNWSREPTKSGVEDMEQLRAMVEVVAGLPELALTGLMTIPDPEYTQSETRGHYAQIRECFGQIKQEFGLGESFRDLSMGMSHDYRWAIEEGATVVRVGTAIFGARS